MFSILSTDQKVNDSYSIELKNKKVTDRHVSNGRFSVTILLTKQSQKRTVFWLPLKEIEKQTNMYGQCTELWAKIH